MKFYAIVYGNYQGISDADVVDIYSTEAAAEKAAESWNDGTSPDEWYEVREWDEELVEKFWKELEID